MSPLPAHDQESCRCLLTELAARFMFRETPFGDVERIKGYRLAGGGEKPRPRRWPRATRMAAPGDAGLLGDGLPAHRRAYPAVERVGARACPAVGTLGPSSPHEKGGMPATLT